MKPIVTYIRVSTSQQGRSGLAIDAQREALAHFAKEAAYEIAAEFVEVETGKGKRRARPSAAIGGGAGESAGGALPGRSRQA